MDYFEWNKLAGGVLSAALLVLSIKLTTAAIFDVAPSAIAAYHADGSSEGDERTSPLKSSEAVPDFAVVFSRADISAGSQVSAKCQQCHDISKDGPNRIGPELWNIVGRPRASQPGYTYSSAMSAEHTPWTDERLYRFLKSPQLAVPGTKMGFGGLRSSKDLIDLLAFLHTRSDGSKAVMKSDIRNPKRA